MSSQNSKFVSKGLWKRRKSFIPLSKKASSKSHLVLRKKEPLRQIDK